MVPCIIQLNFRLIAEILEQLRAESHSGRTDGRTDAMTVDNNQTEISYVCSRLQNWVWSYDLLYLIPCICLDISYRSFDDLFHFNYIIAIPRLYVVVFISSGNMLVTYIIGIWHHNSYICNSWYNIYVLISWNYFYMIHFLLQKIHLTKTKCLIYLYRKLSAWLCLV